MADNCFVFELEFSRKFDSKFYSNSYTLYFEVKEHGEKKAKREKQRLLAILEYKIMIHIDLIDVNEKLLLLRNCALFTRNCLPLFYVSVVIRFALCLAKLFVSLLSIFYFKRLWAQNTLIVCLDVVITIYKSLLKQ